MTTPIKPLPHVLDIEPYLPGDSALAGAARIIKLSSNESPLGPGPAAREAAMRSLQSLERYPESSARIVRRALGEAYGLDPERIVCEAGSEQLINLIARTFAGPGDEILYSAHGFIAYRIAALSCGARPVAAPERDLVTDVDALLARVTARTRILFLANPNNPTGTCLPREEIRRLRAGLPESVLLVLDGAYAEYVDWPAYCNGLEMVNDEPGNVLVLRTFSKIHGLAALRVGWSYSSLQVALALHRLRGVFSVSSVAQAAAVAAVGDTDHLARAQAHNTRWRTWLSEQFRSLGLELTHSLGNFVLVKLGSPARAQAADLALRAAGIIPRTLKEYGLADCLRITVGLEEDNQALVDAMAAFLTQNPGPG